MIRLDLFDGGYGLGEEVALGGVVALHLPGVVDGLDDTRVDGSSSPFLGRFTNRRRQALHLGRPILGGLLQLRPEDELLHLLPNGGHANFLVVDRGRPQRIRRLRGASASVVDASVVAVVGGYLGPYLLPRLDDVARFDVDVSEVGHGRGEGGVGLVEDRRDGVEGVVEVEGYQPEFLLLLFDGGGGGGGCCLVLFRRGRAQDPAKSAPPWVLGVVMLQLPLDVIDAGRGGVYYPRWHKSGGEWDLWR
mmetsp:Transcript_7283/g.18104  ORF Transcript_7283/g.18104 Transcript_7283/m.18104 type:complete len:248 (+) Transcript_7283:1739-2482(+)